MRRGCLRLNLAAAAAARQSGCMAGRLPQQFYVQPAAVSPHSAADTSRRRLSPLLRYLHERLPHVEVVLTEPFEHHYANDKAGSAHTDGSDGDEDGGSG